MHLPESYSTANGYPAKAMNLSNHINFPQQPPNQVINIQTPTKQVINIQTINFRGGEIQQKGRGIRGFSFGLINLISPEARSEVSTHAKAATSNTAKDIEDIEPNIEPKY